MLPSVHFEERRCQNGNHRTETKISNRQQKAMGVRRKWGAIWLNDGRGFCSLEGSLGKMRCTSSSCLQQRFWKILESHWKYWHYLLLVLSQAWGLLSDICGLALTLIPAWCCILYRHRQLSKKEQSSGVSGLLLNPQLLLYRCQM